MTGSSPARPPGPPDVLRLFLRMGGWGVIILGVLVLIVSLLSASRLSLAREFERDGRLTRAEVVQKFVRIQTSADGGQTYGYFVRFGFDTPDGQRIQVQRALQFEDFELIDEGQSLDLRYLPDDPETILLASDAYKEGGTALRRIALVGGLVWLWSLWRVGGWAVDAVRAREYGVSEEVEVVKVQRTAVRMNRQRLFRLVWRDAAGHQDHSMLNWRKVVARFRPGDRIEVYRGSRHMWWPGDVGDR